MLAASATVLRLYSFGNGTLAIVMDLKVNPETERLRWGTQAIVNFE